MHTDVKSFQIRYKKTQKTQFVRQENSALNMAYIPCPVCSTNLWGIYNFKHNKEELRSVSIFATRVVIHP